MDVVRGPNPDQGVERKIEELAWVTSTVYRLTVEVKDPLLRVTSHCTWPEYAVLRLDSPASVYRMHLGTSSFPPFDLHVCPTSRHSSVPEVTLLCPPYGLGRQGPIVSQSRSSVRFGHRCISPRTYRRSCSAACRRHSHPGDGHPQPLVGDHSVSCNIHKVTFAKFNMLSVIS